MKQSNDDAVALFANFEVELYIDDDGHLNVVIDALGDNGNVHEVNCRDGSGWRAYRLTTSAIEKAHIE